MEKRLLFLMLPLIFFSCGQQTSNTNSQLTGEIKIDGSSTVFPITEAMAEEFRYEHPNVKITVGLSGTGGGFKKFCRGEINISNASRSIKAGEVQSCKEANIHFLELSVAYDGLAVVVNPENDWVDFFTVAELKKIWEPSAQDEIKRWSQIRAGWPDEELRLFGPGIASGTYDYFTEAIIGESGKSRGDFTASEDDNVLVQGVSGDKYGLGFFGLAYYEENKASLKVVPVDNGAGPVLPAMETVRNKTYMPLSRPLFIYLNNSAKQPEIDSFVNFYLDLAPDLMAEIGFIAMPAEEYAEQKKKFNDFVSSLSQNQ